MMSPDGAPHKLSIQTDGGGKVGHLEAALETKHCLDFVSKFLNRDYLDSFNLYVYGGLKKQRHVDESGGRTVALRPCNSLHVFSAAKSSWGKALCKGGK